MPRRDFWAGRDQSCPVYCTEQQDYCFAPSFGANGNLLSMGESCVPKGGACDCSKGQNAVSCNVSGFVECISRKDYCPMACGSGQVTCPALEDFNADGHFLGTRPPSVACVANYSSCECGMQAKKCTEGDFSWCIPRKLQCPVTCRDDQNVCFLDDFDANGRWLSDRQVCAAKNATCPCGRNAGTCPDDPNMCHPTTDLKFVCTCTAAERECPVVDFGVDGMPEDFSSICVASGTACPCGKNAHRCADPNSVSDNFCIPKSTRFGPISCPTPCAPNQLYENQTCEQINMDTLGNILSASITCVKKGSCTPGRNMKQCPEAAGGAVVHSSVQCRKLYDFAAGDAPAVPEGVEETSTVFLSIAAADNAAKGVGMATSQLRGLLQLPPTLSISMFLNTQTQQGGGRRMSTASASRLRLEIKTNGASHVSSGAAAGQLRTVFQTGELTKAVSAVGVPDMTKAPLVKIESKKVKTRAAAAIAAGLAPPTPSPVPTPSPTPTPTPTPTPGGSTNTSLSNEDGTADGASGIAFSASTVLVVVFGLFNLPSGGRMLPTLS